MSKKVLLTGATGLIGKEIIQPLKELGYEISALTIDENNPDNGINWIKCNLFDEEAIKQSMEQVKPTHLLNFAWATTGDYLTSGINLEFVKAGLNLLKYFKLNGGKRAVYVGTCFEYKFKDEPLKEYDSLNPQTLYAKSKNALHEIAEEFCKVNDISFGYGRIFYVFGHGENEKRLTAHLIKTLSENKEVIINCGSLIKDYMYTKDIANAFVKFLCTDVDGCVNIATGKAISLEDFALTFANLMGKEELVIVKNEVGNQPPLIVADIARLKDEVKFDSKYTVEQAVREILSL